LQPIILNSIRTFVAEDIKMATIAPVMIQSPADPFVRNAEKTSAVVSEVAYLNGSSDSSGSSTPPSALDGNDVCIVGMGMYPHNLEKA
jgi:hypothetical protein